MTTPEFHCLPWVTSEVECLECGNRWVAVRQLGTTLECPDCGSREIDPDAIEGTQ